MIWITFNSETRRLIVVRSAVSEEDARQLAAPEGSDGDEVAVVGIAEMTPQPIIDITDQLGVE